MAKFHKTPDSEREKFRRYLDKGGVTGSLTSVLVTLYEHQEKPNNPLEFIKQYLKIDGYTSGETESLEQELTDLRQKCARLTKENEELRAKLRHYESANGV